MTFKPALWRPIAAVLSVVNLGAVGFAAGAAEPWHATIHAGLALAFAAWAQRLGRSPAQPAFDRAGRDVSASCAARADSYWAMAVSVSIRVVIGDGVRFCFSTSVAYRRQSAHHPFGDRGPRNHPRADHGAMPSTTRMADTRSQPFTACRIADLVA